MRVPIAIAVALASAVVWLALLLTPWLPLPPLPGLEGYFVPPVLLPLAGAALAVAIVALRPTLMQLSPPATMTGVLRGLLVTIALTGLVAILLAGIQSGEVKATNAALVLVCTTITVFVALFALENVRDGGGVSFDSNWGGLGGGLGGWRVSSAAVYLILLLVFAGATLGAAFYAPEAGDAGDEEPTQAAGAAPAESGKVGAGSASKPK